MFQHKELAGGGWQKFTLMEQMGNIGSEVSRALRVQGKDDKLFQSAIDRALELFDLTIGDSRWRNRLREITRAREMFCDAILGGKEHGSTLEDLERYFLYFALVARAAR